jgi:hypothetical protein
MVFSFGVMLLEIICCRRHVEPYQNHDEDERGSEDDDLVLVNLVLRCMVSKKLEIVVSDDLEVLNDMILRGLSKWLWLDYGVFIQT